MKMVELKKNGQTLIRKCRIAADFFTRFLGLMGKMQLREDEALCFPKCNSIHTFFMRIPIDVLFVSKSGKVIEVLPTLKPWKMLLPRLKAAHVIEMKSALAAKLEISVGDQLEIAGVFE